MNTNNNQNNIKFRAAELIICLIAVILGIIYLNTELISLDVLLPVYAVFFTALPVLRLMEARWSGNTKFVAVLPALCYLFLALVVIAATIIYFVKY